MKAAIFLVTFLLAASMIHAAFQCEDLCTIVHGKPICAGPRGSGKAQWQTFDGSCALLIYNCEAKTNWVEQKKGEC